MKLKLLMLVAEMPKLREGGLTREDLNARVDDLQPCLARGEENSAANLTEFQGWQHGYL